MAMQTGGLPGTYLAVEYIENSGTQYIKTNFVPNQNYDISWRFMMTAEQSDDKMMFGCTNRNGLTISAECYNTSRYYCTSGGNRFSNVLGQASFDVRSLNKVYDAEMANGVLTVNGYSANKTGDISTTVNGNKLYIFAWGSSNGNVDYINSGLRMYKLTLRASSGIAADFIPCIRKSDNKPGMYDTVSKTFYTNAGTGEFIVPA